MESKTILINNEIKIRHYPKYLWLFQLSYVVVILIANWFDMRLIKIGFVETDAGILIFPFTYLISDLITEIYGFKFSRIIIWLGLLYNIVFIIFGQIVIHLPSPHYAIEINGMFDKIIKLNVRIIIASGSAYLISEPINSYIMAKLKVINNGMFMSFRFVASTVFSALFDSFIFGFIAFYGIIETHNLIKFNLTLWAIKVFIEILNLPLSLFLVKKVKNLEKMDMYDFDTNYNFFNLNTTYNFRNNKYKN